MKAAIILGIVEPFVMALTQAEEQTDVSNYEYLEQILKPVDYKICLALDSYKSNANTYEVM